MKNQNQKITKIKYQALSIEIGEMAVVMRKRQEEDPDQEAPKTIKFYS